MTTQKQIRKAFWDAFPNFEMQARIRKTKSKGQNAQNADTRTAFVDYVDSLHRGRIISDKLAFSATL